MNEETRIAEIGDIAIPKEEEAVEATLEEMTDGRGDDENE